MKYESNPVDLPGPTRTDENPVIDKFNILVRLANDPSNRNTPEGETAGRMLAALIKNHGLAVAKQGADEKTSNPTPATSAVQTVYVNGVDPWEIGHEISNACLHSASAQSMGTRMMLVMFGLSLDQAISERRGDRRPALEKIFADFAAKLESGLKPMIRERESVSLFIALSSLFEIEPEQHGAAQIAKKIGRRTIDVRKELSKAIRSGWIEAIGTTRNRRYRRVDSGPE